MGAVVLHPATAPRFLKSSDRHCLPGVDRRSGGCPTDAERQEILSGPVDGQRSPVPQEGVVLGRRRGSNLSRGQTPVRSARSAYTRRPRLSVSLPSQHFWRVSRPRTLRSAGAVSFLVSQQVPLCRIYYIKSGLTTPVIIDTIHRTFEYG